MANSLKGEVSLVYSGADYTMVLDFNALCDFEGETGKNALSVLDGGSSMTASDMRALLWAGLRQRHPEMTLSLAGEILSENIDAIGRATAVALPKAAPGNVKRPVKAGR